MSWLSKVVDEAKSKLSHPGAPTEGQLTELVHMLEALGVTVEGKLKATAVSTAAAADAPIAAVETMIATAIAKAKTEISDSLAAVFKEFAAKQVAAVADVQRQLAGLGQLQALVTLLTHPSVIEPPPIGSSAVVVQTVSTEPAEAAASAPGPAATVTKAS